MDGLTGLRARMLRACLSICLFAALAGLQSESAAAEPVTAGLPAALAKLPGDWLALAPGSRVLSDDDEPGLPVIAVRM